MRSQSARRTSKSTSPVKLGSSSPLRQLTWLDRFGKPQNTLGEPERSSHFRLSLDRRRVVVTRVNSAGADLWTLDVARGLWGRFTSRPGINIYPVWSPNSRTIVLPPMRPSTYPAKSIETNLQTLDVNDHADCVDTAHPEAHALSSSPNPRATRSRPSRSSACASTGSSAPSKKISIHWNASRPNGSPRKPRNCASPPKSINSM